MNFNDLSERIADVIIDYLKERGLADLVSRRIIGTMGEKKTEKDDRRRKPAQKKSGPKTGTRRPRRWSSDPELIAWREKIMRPILKEKPRTDRRAAEVARISEREHVLPNGERFYLTKNTIQKWIWLSGHGVEKENDVKKKSMMKVHEFKS